MKFFILIMCFSASLMAGVKITNQRPRGIQVAHAYFQAGFDSINAGEYNFGMGQPPRWRYIGWYSIAPGQSIELGNGWFHIQEFGKTKTFGPEVKQGTGLVQRPNSYDFTVIDKNPSEFERALRKPGMSRAPFWYFKDAHLLINN